MKNWFHGYWSQEGFLRIFGKFKVVEIVAWLKTAKFYEATKIFFQKKKLQKLEILTNSWEILWKIILQWQKS